MWCFRRQPFQSCGIPVLVWLVIFLSQAAGRAAEDRVDFNRDVRPLLSDRCFECHGPDAQTREADLRLDVESSVKELRGDYRVIDSGHPDESELIRRISSGDDADRMPPADFGPPLKPQEIELLRRWIAQGATWATHWAYVAPVRHTAPEVENPRWPKNFIDKFLLAAWEDAGVTPSPDADPVTLIRRLSFDLTGLPPSRAVVEDFTANPTPENYERHVDRFLSEETFAERMTVYWLDLVRYADTVGYHGDQDHSISPYRDWVIDAFHENMPFNEFTRAQLAGDLLTDRTVDDFIASGYNRLLQTSHEGGVQEKEYLAIYAADRVRNLSAVWLGATLGCAQCHDHKYDPLTARDFYSMVAFFADLDEAQHLRKGDNRLPTQRAPEIEVLSKRERRELAEVETELQQLREAGAGTSSEVVQQRLAALEQRRGELQAAKRLTMISAAIEPRTIRILPRGDWLDDSGPVVQPAVPALFGELSVGDRRPNRLDLANWLTDAESGAGLFTARVHVNRLWSLFFGSGLARVLDDFGGQGEAPSHPELLDRLAHEFVAGGWNTKSLVKQLVMSRAYRQLSVAAAERRERDPENRLFARQGRWRLPAEMVRDNALFISGLLVQHVGGPSVKPYQPAGYYRHLNFPKRTYTAHTDERQWRRGLYVHWQRQFLHPMLKAFDAPTREECTAARNVSNTPLASLTLLNDVTFVEAARVFAATTLTDGGASDEQRLSFAFSRAASRPPDSTETALLANLLTANRRRFADDPEAARKLTAVGLAPAESSPDLTEWAAWTMVARAILNLHEVNSRR